MFDQLQQPHHDRGDGREPITSARRAAEALFTPKRQLTEQSVREATLPAGELARKPRVLAINPPAPSHHQEPEVPINPKEQVAPKIPKSQFARIRAWVTYGMTARQVAEVYGASVDEIERILRKP